MSVRDWRSKQFLFYSLVVTASSIMILFAARLIFNKIGVLPELSAPQIVQRLSDLGGIVVRRTELQLKNDQPLPKLFQSQLQSIMDSKLNRSILSASPSALSHELRQLEWIQSAKVSRRFPDEIDFYVEARKPAVALFAGRSWILADESGYFILQTRALLGDFLDLPQVLGLEGKLTGELAEMNRVLIHEQSAISDLVRILRILETRIGFKVMDIRFEDDLWAQHPVFKFVARDPKRPRSQFRIELPSDFGEDRVANLQFVLSDYHDEAAPQLKIQGQYSGRWFVQLEKAGT